jgi:MFS family permease
MQNNKLYKLPFYYGWVIILIAAITYFFSGPGQTYSISIFIEHYINDFGWSRSMVSSLYSFATLAAGFTVSLVGRLIDIHGHRKMGIVIAAILGIACTWSSFVVNPIMLFIGFFLLRLFGQGSMTLSASTIVPQWFVKKRGFALSLMALGGVAGSAAFPPLNAYLDQVWGWQMTWRLWAMLLWLVYIPIAFIFIRNKPEDIGLLPDNRKYEKEVESNKVIKNNVEESWTLREAMGTKAFWLLMFCQAIPSMVDTGIVFHFVSITAENGLSSTEAALILSVMAMVSFPVTFLAGYILDRVKAHYVVALVFVFELIGLILLYNSQIPYLAVGYGVIIGIAKGFNGVCNNVVWANYYGREYLGSIKGFSMTTLVVGSAFGPLPFGIAYDVFGGYRQILFIMMVFPVLAIFAALASPKPRKLVS